MELPNPDDVHDVADWVELELACSTTRISKAILMRFLQAEKGGDADENFVNSVWNELERREEQYVNPPFEVASRTAVRRLSWENNPGYLVCLLFSVYGGSGGLSKSAKVFERLTSGVFQKHFGFKAKIFGWPVEASEPKNIDTRARLLAAAMGERFIEPPNPDKNDDTLDIAAWKPFADTDNRTGHLTVFLQCASGKNWEGKTKDLRLQAWKEYIHWGSCSPVPGFSVPCIVPEKKWVDTIRDAGLLLDRIRIYNILSVGDNDTHLDTEMRHWCEDHIPVFSNS